MTEKNCKYKDELYSVRDDGSVLRHPKSCKKPRPTDNQWTFGKLNVNTGYLEIVSVTVHRIVATAFHGEAPTSQHVVDHKDTNKCNNRPENLRWVTKFENIMLNPITVKRIEWVIGDRIEKFLEDPAKFKDKFQEQNFAWMRSVSAEEGKLTLKRLQEWAKSDKQPVGGTLGEWIYSRGNLYEQQVKDLSEIIPSKTPNAVQRNYKAVCDFPFCPPPVDGDPIAVYAHRLGSGYAFVASDYFISATYNRTISKDGSTMFVISKSQGHIKHWGLTKVTYDNDKFLHENLGVFPELQGEERTLAEEQGLQWTSESPEEEVFKGGTKYDQSIEKISNTIDSKTTGAVQRNWKVPSEFPACPQECQVRHLEVYADLLKMGTVFCRNDEYSATVFKAGISVDGQSLCVITNPETAGGGTIKPFALAAITYENGMFVHESKGTFFEQNGAEKYFSIALGQEWTGGDGIDDYC